MNEEKVRWTTTVRNAYGKIKHVLHFRPIALLQQLRAAAATTMTARTDGNEN